MLILLGGLSGFAYTIDLGVGPPLWFCSWVLTMWRTKSIKATALVLLAALPWLAAHHLMNYAVGGTIKPANAVPEYLDWPDSPFTVNLTGQWSHADAGRFLSYAVQLLIGKRGFLGHNLPLLLVIPAAVMCWRRRSVHLPEVIFSILVCGGVWMIYAMGSTNYAGACCSIRWFVPLLAPGYFVLIVWLRECPEGVPDFAILSIGGAALMATAWPEGPWRLNLLPAHWPIVGATLLAWSIYHRRVRAKQFAPTAASEPARPARAA